MDVGGVDVVVVVVEMEVVGLLVNVVGCVEAGVVIVEGVVGVVSPWVVDEVVVVVTVD